MQCKRIKQMRPKMKNRKKEEKKHRKINGIHWLLNATDYSQIVYGKIFELTNNPPNSNATRIVREKIYYRTVNRKSNKIRTHTYILYSLTKGGNWMVCFRCSCNLMAKSDVYTKIVKLTRQWNIICCFTVCATIN